jgi:hypothetical protein
MATGDVVLQITWVLGSYYKLPKREFKFVEQHKIPQYYVCNDYDSITAIDLYSDKTLLLIASIPRRSKGMDRHFMTKISRNLSNGKTREKLKFSSWSVPDILEVC